MSATCGGGWGADNGSGGQVRQGPDRPELAPRSGDGGDGGGGGARGGGDGIETRGPQSMQSEP